MFGIAEQQHEDTESAVIKLFNDKLGVSITSDTIDRCYRVGRFQKNKPGSRPIIVKFVSYKSRLSVCKARKKLKGSGISIHDDLTSKKYNLLKEVREELGNESVCD